MSIMPDQSNGAFNATATAAGSDPARMPGLFRLSTDDWVNSLADLRAPCAALDDGLLYLDVVIHVASNPRTAVLMRSEAGERAPALPRSVAAALNDEFPIRRTGVASRAEPRARRGLDCPRALETCWHAHSGRVGLIATGEVPSQAGLGLA